MRVTFGRWREAIGPLLGAGAFAVLGHVSRDTPALVVVAGLFALYHLVQVVRVFVGKGAASKTRSE